MFYAVIMAGGAGERFWPLSRRDRPKQFLSLVEERTMLQLTFDRLAGLVPPENVLVITGVNYIETVRQQLPEIPPENIVAEPCGRDTAAAVGHGRKRQRNRGAGGFFWKPATASSTPPAGWWPPWGWRTR